MPWGVVVAFTCYAALLIWQTANQFETGSSRGLVAVPLLLVKLAVMLVALTYWQPPLCHMAATNLGWHSFGFALILAIIEAAHTLKAALAHPDQPQRNFLLGFAFVTTILLPAVVLLLAGRVLLLHDCASP